MFGSKLIQEKGRKTRLFWCFHICLDEILFFSSQQIEEELNEQLFDNLVSFLRRSHSAFQEKKTEWTCRTKSREIPTAALVLGNFLKIHSVMSICTLTEA